MTKIALTGSIASGKTTASRFISNNRGPLFSADEIVKKLYKKKDFRIKIAKEFKINPEIDEQLIDLLISKLK